MRIVAAFVHRWAHNMVSLACTIRRKLVIFMIHFGNAVNMTIHRQIAVELEISVAQGK
jgi:hypothetical protein